VLYSENGAAGSRIHHQLRHHQRALIAIIPARQGSSQASLFAKYELLDLDLVRLRRLTSLNLAPPRSSRDRPRGCSTVASIAPADSDEQQFSSMCRRKEGWTARTVGELVLRPIRTVGLADQQTSTTRERRSKIRQRSADQMQRRSADRHYLHRRHCSCTRRRRLGWGGRGRGWVGWGGGKWGGGGGVGGGGPGVGGGGTGVQAT